MGVHNGKFESMYFMMAFLETNDPRQSGGRNLMLLSSEVCAICMTKIQENDSLLSPLFGKYLLSFLKKGDICPTVYSGKDEIVWK